jgi:hypothetical protein
MQRRPPIPQPADHDVARELPCLLLIVFRRTVAMLTIGPA